MSKKYIVEWKSGDKEWSETFSSTDEIKDYCYPIWNVQRFQVYIDNDYDVCLTDKLGKLFAVVGKVTCIDNEI